MAAVTTVTTTKVKILVDNGTTESGDVKTASISFPAISNTGYNATKALAIANAVEPCLSKSIYILNQEVTSRIDEE